nr:Fe-Mn family superoxide dismutase [Parachlamydia acanthamoebae]
MQYKLPDLPYDLGDLEPVISKEIMSLHYNKHHATYVANLNKALEQYAEAEAKNDLPALITLQSAINFNGGGHINHSIFWTNLAPQKSGGGAPPEGAIAEAIQKQFGSLEKFIETMNTKTAAIQGSGWGWLGYCKNKKQLEIVTCSNQDPLAAKGLVPLLGIDVWEHAYYLQYKNVRADYLKAIWNIVNWKNVEERFTKAKAE